MFIYKVKLTHKSIYYFKFSCNESGVSHRLNDRFSTRVNKLFNGSFLYKLISYQLNRSHCRENNQASYCGIYGS